ncbi:GNAT family N-acetyltransferase [Veronia pacifica]|uniref:GNAT family N-acetyltransferase n=1 Tax=Veronia pacifica TaxID=1080227 RepID=A0A1C3EE25_9GAMM|nr:GNAT family N-acetyltransferase [Veronia pacifica]ODA31460.1 GNAT family N-acetyltransferase [Veronia pacifica]
MSKSTVIREATESDLHKINEIYNFYVENTSITFDYDLWTLDKRLSWFYKISTNPSFSLVVAEKEGNIIGFAYNSEFREKRAYAVSSEITIYTDHNNRHPGTGSLLMQTLLDKIKETNIHRLFSVITLPNDASIAIHKKFGFDHVGTLDEAGFKFNRFFSVAIYQLKVTP